jgi:hypothetical protein
VNIASGIAKAVASMTRCNLLGLGKRLTTGYCTSDRYATCRLGSRLLRRGLESCSLGTSPDMEGESERTEGGVIAPASSFTPSDSLTGLSFASKGELGGMGITSNNLDGTAFSVVGGVMAGYL